MTAFMTGGRHERNRRAGTENVAGIAGLGIAAALARVKEAAEAARVSALRDRLERDVLDQQETADYARTHRLSGTVEAEHRATGALGGNVAFAGIDAEREQADAVIYGSPLDTVNRDRALFARDDWTHGRHQLALGLRASEYESFGGHTTGAANYGLRIADNGFAWIAGGRAFRPAAAPGAATASCRTGPGNAASLHELPAVAASDGYRPPICQKSLSYRPPQHSIAENIPYLLVILLANGVPARKSVRRDVTGSGGKSEPSLR